MLPLLLRYLLGYPTIDTTRYGLAFQAQYNLLKSDTAILTICFIKSQNRQILTCKRSGKYYSSHYFCSNIEDKNTKIKMG